VADPGCLQAPGPTTSTSLSSRILRTGLWQDTAAIPSALAATLDRAEGFTEVAALIKRPGARRVIVSGSGASFYAAMALWLAALDGDRLPVEVQAVPAGLLARDAFRWRTGDTLLAMSSSGESRDLIEAVESERIPTPFAMITAEPSSTIAQRAGAVARTVVSSADAITHTQAFCGSLVASLAIWSLATQDTDLSAAVAAAPLDCSNVIARTLPWASEVLGAIALPPAAIMFGTGPAWVAALEGALLMKEVSRIPCEGSETREGATTLMTGLLPGHLAIGIPLRDDPLAEEAEIVCRSVPCQFIRAPGGDEGDRRLAAVTAFAPMVALCIHLGLSGAWDVDRPSWYSRYEATARR
jgi:fructoselysine-6-P-deglycase FrlB-like protein